MEPTSAYAFASLSLLFLSGFLSTLRVQYNEVKKQYDEFRDFIKDEAKKTLTEKPDRESKSIDKHAEYDEHIYRRACYYILHSGYKDDLPVKKLKPELCTHLIVGFGRVRKNVLVPERPKDAEIYKQVTALKSKHLKVMLSIGAITNGEFSLMVNSPVARLRFINSSLDFCNTYGFDGLDFDWEYPSWKGAPFMDKVNFVYLIKEFREVLKRREQDMIFSTAVGAPLAIVLSSYIIPDLAEVVDFVNLMSFDFHPYHPERLYTGHNSPLYKRPEETDYFATLNTAWAAQFWAHNGMPRDKIVVGVPTFARTFHLVYPYGQEVDSAVDGPGLGDGFLSYSEVCKFLKNGGRREFDVHAQVPFAFKDHQWVSYEDERSLAIKARWVLKNGFGGIMTFNLNNDDWKGQCDNYTTFPLQRAIAKVFG